METAAGLLGFDAFAGAFQTLDLHMIERVMVAEAALDGALQRETSVSPENA